jgi:transposase
VIPRKPGDLIKTDRRDAVNLAKLHRAGELTSVWVPDQAHEAIRDLVQPYLAAVRTLRQARQQLSGFLLRHGHHYNRPAWTLLHRRWLAGLKFEQATHHIVLVCHRNRRPAVHETCGIVFRPLAERLAVLWCERARVLVEPGAPEAPPIAPWAARLGSALFRL